MKTMPAKVQSAATEENPSRLRRPSEFLRKWFAWWLRGYLKRHFHAVRLSKDTCPKIPTDTPLIIVLNHPSWWDPLFGVILADLFPGRTHYAPMDAQSLSHHRLFTRLGFYGVEQGSARGAIRFLRTTAAILSQPGATVWITAQGRFTDPRVRPAQLRSGVGHIAQHLDRGIILTLALEYPFWDERLPEALARFGEPIVIENGPDLRASQWLERIEANLMAAQDALKMDALSRKPGNFLTLIEGNVAIGGIYDFGRRVMAWLRGRRFQSKHHHGDEPPCS